MAEEEEAVKDVVSAVVTDVLVEVEIEVIDVLEVAVAIKAKRKVVLVELKEVGKGKMK